MYSYFKGLQLLNTQASQLSIKISSGEIFPSDMNWNQNLGYRNIVEKLVSIEQNKSIYPRIDTIVARPDTSLISSNYAGITFSVIKGSIGQNPSPNSEILPDDVFLGWVFVPSEFPVRPNILCTRTLAESETASTKIDSPITRLSQILSSVEIWQSEKLYFYGQLVKYDNSIFICKIAHGSGSSIYTDASNGLWETITAEQNDLENLIQEVLLNLIPEYIKHPSSQQFSVQFNVDGNFEGSDKLVWNKQFNSLQIDGNIYLKNQTTSQQTPTNGINIYSKISGLIVEGVIQDESGTERTLFTLKK